MFHIHSEPNFRKSYQILVRRTSKQILINNFLVGLEKMLATLEMVTVTQTLDLIENTPTGKLICQQKVTLMATHIQYKIKQ